jgi:hypothetical protein
VHKLFVRLLLILAVFAGLTIPAKAQAVDQLIVKVPFPFVAAGQTFSAGEYKISRLRDEEPRILVLTSLENRAAVVTLLTESHETSNHKGQLVFTTVGDQHVLSSVQTYDNTYALAVPRADTFLAAMPRKGAAASSASGSN